MRNSLTISILVGLSSLFHGCIPKKDCPPTSSISFRGIEISFPMTGLQVWEKQKGVFYRNGILTTSKSEYGGNQSLIIWFPSRGDFPSPMQDTIPYLSEREVYGITFFLRDREERDLTDREMAEKVREELNLPGEFVLKTKPGRAFYHYQEGCLSIITSLSGDQNGPYPLVSFCYGLEDEELFYYSTGPGQRYSD